jgi:ATP-dependent protease ClpP protease subunit
MSIKEICKKMLFGLILIAVSCSSSKIVVPEQNTPTAVQPNIAPTDVIVFNAAINEENVNKLIVAMSAEQTAGAQEIKIIMHSSGGSVEAGQKLVLVMENLGLPITIIADGSCFSMCYYVLQAADHREMTKRTVLMIHNQLFSVSAKSIKDLAFFLKFATIYENSYWEFLANRMKLSKDELKSMVIQNNGEYSFGYEEALEIGSVDEIIEPLRSKGAILIVDD